MGVERRKMMTEIRIDKLHPFQFLTSTSGCSLSNYLFMSANPNLPPSALARRWYQPYSLPSSSSSSSSSSIPVGPNSISHSYRRQSGNESNRSHRFASERSNYPADKWSRSCRETGQYRDERPQGYPSRDSAYIQNEYSSTTPHRSSRRSGHVDRNFEHDWRSSTAFSRHQDRSDRSSSPRRLNGRNDHHQAPHPAAPTFPAHADRQAVFTRQADHSLSNLPSRPHWSSSQTVASTSPPAPSSSPQARSRPSYPTKRRAVPLPEYLESAKKNSVRLDVPSVERKLVLLDLNGTLVFRPKASSERTYRRRPFVGAFLNYLRARWEVGVWSSAQPHSVSKMIEFLELSDGKGPHRLKFIWARDTFGLTPAEFNQKTETVKDLDVVYKHLDKESSADEQSVTYSNESTLLIDDSHTKTGCQPFNHIPVPDYDGLLSTQSAQALKDASAAARSNKKKKKKATGSEAATGDGEEEDMTLDRTLLAVVGILERARGEESMVAWLRTGGLVPDLTDPDGWWVSTRSLDEEKKDGNAGGEDKNNLNLAYPARRGQPIMTISRSDLLPSESSLIPNVPWFRSPDHLDFWTRRGIETLRSMRIDMSHGMDLSFLPRTDEEIATARAKKLAKAERQTDCSARKDAKTGGT